jgi:uncharacterized repeat protein (TIGR04042 family)
MPEMHFSVRWPDGSTYRCYSPSLVIKEFLVVGEAYPLADFVARSRTALETGSERVRKKYGYACGHAMAEVQEIERMAAQFAAQKDAYVVVERFEE